MSEVFLMILLECFVQSEELLNVVHEYRHRVVVLLLDFEGLNLNGNWQVLQILRSDRIDDGTLHLLAEAADHPLDDVV